MPVKRCQVSKYGLQLPVVTQPAPAYTKDSIPVGRTHISLPVTQHDTGHLYNSGQFHLCRIVRLDSDRLQLSKGFGTKTVQKENLRWEEGFAVRSYLVQSNTPVAILKDHHITKMIISQCHENVKHQRKEPHSK
ncbi:hypothetical protein DPEC_G00376450 [Dallia pectoralis]|nr:hypothetical protein DPEC_G00376450 [Dallia pectoralis]